MPKVRLILDDDNGVTTEQIYDLPEGITNLDGIDEAVEQFRLEALPVLEKQLLEKLQQTAVQQEKKTVPMAERDGNADPTNPPRSLPV
jgi:hypothetical protein